MSVRHHSFGIGVDIGGTGIKAGLVDVTEGALAGDRLKAPTPEGATPREVIEVTRCLIRELCSEYPDTPVGIAFPAVVKEGITLSAANVSDEWVGFDAADRFCQLLERPVGLINDADAAGLAEQRFGAAADCQGTVLLTTLGTGIGTALIRRGVLLPNTELGHLEIDGSDAETRASNAARLRDALSWHEWATQRLERYFDTCERLLSPDLIVVGGGVSKKHKHFLPLLQTEASVVPARFRNNAGILGAAAAVVGKDSPDNSAGTNGSADTPGSVQA